MIKLVDFQKCESILLLEEIIVTWFTVWLGGFGVFLVRDLFWFIKVDIFICVLPEDQCDMKWKQDQNSWFKGKEGGKF